MNNDDNTRTFSLTSDEPFAEDALREAFRLQLQALPLQGNLLQNSQRRALTAFLEQLD